MQEKRKHKGNKAVVRGLVPGRIRVRRIQAARFVVLIRQLVSLTSAFLEQPVNDNFTRIKIQLQSLNELVSSMRFTLKERRGMRDAVQQIVTIPNADNLQNIVARLSGIVTLLQSYGERIGVSSVIDPEVTASIFKTVSADGVQRHAVLEPIQGNDPQSSGEPPHAGDPLGAGRIRMAGRKGSTGAVGTPGAEGLPGTAGAMKATGVTGVVRVTGLPGPRGAKRTSSGVTGPIGVPRTMSATGAIGITDVMGEISATGATGGTGTAVATGVTASIASTTSTASTASIRVTGTAGITGVAGSTGDKGPTGTIGVTGERAAAGTVGSIGVTGVTGKGTAGMTGPADVTGITGSTGASGVIGAADTTGPTDPGGVIGGTVVFHAAGRTQSVAASSPIIFSQNTLQGVTFNGSTTLTINTAGFYCFNWRVVLSSEQNSPSIFGIVVNSNTISANMTSSADDDLLAGSAVINMNVGDTVQLYNLSAQAKAVTSTQNAARLNIFRIGP